MGVGARLEQLLEDCGRNVNEVAIEINESPQTLYSIINRDNDRVDIKLLRKICIELDTTLEYFANNNMVDRDAGDIALIDENSKTIARAIKILNKNPEIAVLVNKVNGTSMEDIKRAIAIIEALQKQK